MGCVCPGFSVVYLIEAAYQDVDTGSTVLPYYNASNPSQAYSGPNNTGISQSTIRQGLCKIQVKTGVAAATGTQVTPSPDAGFTGLYAVTVANGQSTITSGNIVQLTTAPFISPKLTSFLSAIQNGTGIYAADTSGTANTVTISLTPAPASLTAGMGIRVKVANTNTGAVVINTNSLGNVAANLPDGSAIPSGRLIANGIYHFIYDGTYWQYQSPTTRVQLTANTTFYVATTGNDSTGLGTSTAPWATIQHAINFIQQSIDLAGFTATISVANGTYSSAVIANAPFTGSGVVQITGNTSSPSSCIISTTSTGITAQNDAQLSLAGLEITTSAFNGIQAQYGGQITINGNMNIAACAGAQIGATGCGVIRITSNYTISGNSSWHWLAEEDAVISAQNLTITLTGTPAFGTTFAQADTAATISCPSNTFSGNTTGSRYIAKNNGTIFTNGANGTYLPGNSAGTGTNAGTSPYGLYA